MCDQRDAGGEETRIVRRAGYVLAELGGELAKDRRDVNADLLENATVHDRHDAATARRAGVIGAVPGRADETPGRTVGQRCARREGVLQFLERGHDPIAQRGEPSAGAGLACFGQVRVHGRSEMAWR